MSELSLCLIEILFIIMRFFKNNENFLWNKDQNNNNNKTLSAFFSNFFAGKTFLAV